MVDAEVESISDVEEYIALNGESGWGLVGFPENGSWWSLVSDLSEMGWRQGANCAVHQ